MRSSELAKLAGVTVRTLRHYHAIELLPEPERSANGYREYEVSDLVHLLRIKRLSALGFPLSRIGDVLSHMDKPGAASSTTAPLLDELDDELVRQIEHLQQQRQIIAQLKEEGLDADMPLSIAGLMKLYSEGSRPDRPSELAKADRMTILLASNLSDERDLAEAERVLTAARDQGIMPAFSELERRIDDLVFDASEEIRAQLVIDALQTIEPIISLLNVESWTRDESEAEALIDGMMKSDVYNPAQLDVIGRIEWALEERVRVRLATES